MKSLKNWAPTIIWAILIFTLSSISALKASNNPLLQNIINISAHFTEYYILAILAFSSLQKDKASKPLEKAAMLATIYSLSDEFHQYFVPGRMFDAKDILVDLIGVIAATLWIQRNHRKIPRRRQVI